MTKTKISQVSEKPEPRQRTKFKMSTKIQLETQEETQDEAQSTYHQDTTSSNKQTVDRSHNIKRYASLVLLVIQNAVLVLISRYSRTMPGDRYFATTAVICQEILKFLASIVIIYVNDGFFSLLSQINQSIIANPLDNLRVAVPSTLYMIQNNLFYVGISNLPAATFQVIFQMKLLTTALFAVLILGRKLNLTKWASLVILSLGVAAVQIEATISKDQKEANSTNQNPLLGFMAVLAACMTSGFAGVYFEKILKDSEVSLWIRNIQLGVIGALMGAATAYFSEGKEILEHGFFYGYNEYTIGAIFTQALGGLIIACVVKYADSILKGFATSLAIILSCVMSVFLFNFQVTPVFVVGATMVVGSVYIYSK